MASKKTSKEDSVQPASADEGKGGTRRRSRGGRGRKTAAKVADGGGAATAVAEARAAAGSAPAPGRVVVEREIGGRMLTIETGRFARQADGACVVRYGDTMVLATAQSAKAPEHIDFFPLTVDYREKTAAAGMIPGGFFKREGRPTTKEILACRLIDRSIRPMFPDGFRKEVQVMSQVLSTDRENDPDVVAAVASFAALAISSIPHGRTLGMCRIGLRDDKLLINPTWSVLQSAENQLNLTVAGHADAIVMVEAGARQVPEEVMLEALELGHRTARQIAEMVDELVQKAGKPKAAFDPPPDHSALRKEIESRFGSELRKAPVSPGTKHERSAAVKAAKELATKGIPAPAGSTPEQQKAHEKLVGEICGEITKQAERDSILKGVRADGRDTRTIRPITIDVGVLPRVHGSVLFTRGETQALGIVTLGGTDDQQIIDGLMPEPRKRFLLHYAFPPFSVGEVKRLGGPGRREIGHGALAERSLEAVLPSREEFPYTIRITSEILESNGSSSMATVCAGTLAMMDAGVKIQQPVAGIAMGLVMAGKKYAILSDILGSEDGCGDMDFKVAGTGKGITALQMDIKCEGLTRQILSEALAQAREGRLHILRRMLETLRAPRTELSPNAPRLESLMVPSEKIGLIIGPAGRNIRQMQEDFECKISIEDGGLCTITGVNPQKVMACVDYIKTMTAEVQLGAIYEGRVTAIKEFGAFVEVLPSQEGLVHVSELSDGFLRSVTDAVRIGDVIKVKVIGIDDFGKIKLSRKAVLLAERGGAPAEAGTEPAAPAGEGQERDRGERGRDRDRGGRDRDRGHDRGRDRDRGGDGGFEARRDRGDRGRDRGPEREGRDRDRDRGPEREGRDRDHERGPDRGRGRDRDRERGEPRDRQDAPQFGDERRRGRSGPPMAEFDPVDADLEPFEEEPVIAEPEASEAAEVGELEEVEDFLGEGFGDSSGPEPREGGHGGGDRGRDRGRGPRRGRRRR